MSRPAGLGIIARNFVALGAGEILSRLIGFGCTIWVARQLGIDGYGVIGFAFTITMYAAAVTDFGLEQHGPREVALHRDDPGPLIASVGAARVVIGLALAALMAGGGLAAPEPDGRILLLFGLTLIPAGGSMRWLHVGLQRSGVASAARVTGESLRLAILLLAVRAPSAIAIVPLAQLAGDAVATAILLVAIRRSERLNLRIDPALAIAVLRRASPLLLANLLGYVIYNSDVILLRIARPVAEVGLYLAAYAPINLLGVLGNTIALSLIPGLAEPGRDRGARQSIVDGAILHVMALAIPLAVGGTLLARPLITIAFGADYEPAATVLAILIWTFPLLLIRSVQQAALIAVDARGDVLRTTAWAAAMNVGLNIVIVP
ncbi:MAG: flippase, partial [Gemmatimonadota bacterium]